MNFSRMWRRRVGKLSKAAWNKRWSRRPSKSTNSVNWSRSSRQTFVKSRQQLVVTHFYSFVVFLFLVFTKAFRVVNTAVMFSNKFKQNFLSSLDAFESCNKTLTRISPSKCQFVFETKCSGLFYRKYAFLYYIWMIHLHKYFLLRMIRFFRFTKIKMFFIKFKLSVFKFKVSSEASLEKTNRLHHII